MGEMKTEDMIKDLMEVDVSSASDKSFDSRIGVNVFTTDVGGYKIAYFFQNASNIFVYNITNMRYNPNQLDRNVVSQSERMTTIDLEMYAKIAGDDAVKSAHEKLKTYMKKS